MKKLLMTLFLLKLFMITGWTNTTNDTIPQVSYNSLDSTYTFDYWRTMEHRKMREENKVLKAELRLYYALEDSQDSLIRLNTDVIASFRYVSKIWKAKDQDKDKKIESLIVINDMQKDLINEGLKVSRKLQRKLNWSRMMNYGQGVVIIAALLKIVGAF